VKVVRNAGGGGDEGVPVIEPSPELARTRVRLFAEAVRAGRTALGLGREELAERARLDGGVIDAIEDAVRGPDLQEFFELAEGLGMDAEELLRSAYREDNRGLWQQPQPQDRAGERPGGPVSP
jgi:transcriptional regulator with XRE-family HTH domain